MWAVILAIGLSGDRLADVVIPVERLEINHVYTVCQQSGRYREAFAQVIVWEWSYWAEDWRVREWWIYCGAARVTINGRRCYRFEHEKAGWRTLCPVWCHETWTPYDPELIDRRGLPLIRRRGLPR